MTGQVDTTGAIVPGTMIERFTEYLRGHGKQPATVESYGRDAQQFLDYLGRCGLRLGQVEPGTLLEYQNYLRAERGERDNSVRRSVIGIRQFFRFLSAARLLPMTPFDAVPIPNRQEGLARVLGEDIIDAIFAAAAAGGSTCKVARDRALLALLAYEGLKANEIITLRWIDYLQDGSGGSLHVRGSRARGIKITAATTAFLNAYKCAFAQLPVASASRTTERCMFIAFKGRDVSSPLPVMTRHGLKFILYELGAKVGLPMLNTEQLRHHAVAFLIADGRSPEDIMSHLGLRRLGNISKHLGKRARTVGKPPAVEADF